MGNPGSATVFDYEQAKTDVIFKIRDNLTVSGSNPNCFVDIRVYIFTIFALSKQNRMIPKSTMSENHSAAENPIKTEMPVELVVTRMHSVESQLAAL